jgi:hypothetical protein
MERIEIPATAYWQANDGKRFTSQEDCERWESLYPKWTNSVRYREFENEEGQLCYAFWIETEADLKDILWFFDHKLHTCTRNLVNKPWDTPQWVVIHPFYDGYNADYEALSMEEYRDLLDETLKAVQDTLSAVVKMIWEKA